VTNLQGEERERMDSKIKVALIYGSARNGRFCDTVARWAAQQITANGKFLPEVVDPAVVTRRLASAPETSDDSASVRQRIAEVDAFVVVTPEYNHGYPAPLKALIDSVGQEWHAKPVGFVSYGGISGGLRAVEQLRQVFAELHTVTIRDAVSFSSAWEQFDAAGVLVSPERAQKSMTLMLERLHWWAVALRNARGAVPYSLAA
jgi:NAD(P)H-dependent FMN reductase